MRRLRPGDTRVSSRVNEAQKYGDALKSYSKALENLKPFAGEDPRLHFFLKLPKCLGCVSASFVTPAQLSDVPLEAEGSHEDLGGRNSNPLQSL